MLKFYHIFGSKGNNYEPIEFRMNSLMLYSMSSIITTSWMLDIRIFFIEYSISTQNVQKYLIISLLSEEPKQVQIGSPLELLSRITQFCNHLAKDLSQPLIHSNKSPSID